VQPLKIEFGAVQGGGEQKLGEAALAPGFARPFVGGLPFRVMVCGSPWARAITSDSRALAPATVQAPFVFWPLCVINHLL
jgi:hypothetical protein